MGYLDTDRITGFVYYSFLEETATSERGRGEKEKGGVEEGDSLGK